MFRTARGFLQLAPPAFLAALLSVVLFYPKAASDFSPYPFLVDALGKTLGQKPIGRFTAVSTLFFLLPYVLTGVLLLISDLGVSSFRRLWQETPPKERPERSSSPKPLLPEARWTFIGVGLLLPLTCGYVLVKAARGGELPGGINVAPFIVAAYPFATTAIALVLTFLVALPRGLFRFIGSPKVTREEGQSRPPRAGSSTP